MPETVEYPPGEYAIVELFGHTTLVGRIAEVERFGTKMLAIEPLYDGQLLGCVFHGGASIYRLTPCTPPDRVGQAAEAAICLAACDPVYRPALSAARRGSGGGRRG
jgi:hypothetical protein